MWKSIESMKLHVPERRKSKVALAVIKEASSITTNDFSTNTSYTLMPKMSPKQTRREKKSDINVYPNDNGPQTRSVRSKDRSMNYRRVASPNPKMQSLFDELEKLKVELQLSAREMEHKIKTQLDNGKMRFMQLEKEMAQEKESRIRNARSPKNKKPRTY